VLKIAVLIAVISAHHAGLDMIPMGKMVLLLLTKPREYGFSLDAFST
jgi:hypothetical protein